MTRTIWKRSVEDGKFITKCRVRARRIMGCEVGDLDVIFRFERFDIFGWILKGTYFDQAFHSFIYSFPSDIGLTSHAASVSKS